MSHRDLTSVQEWQTLFAPVLYPSVQTAQSVWWRQAYGSHEKKIFQNHSGFSRWRQTQRQSTRRAWFDRGSVWDYFVSYKGEESRPRTHGYCFHSHGPLYPSAQ